MLVLVGTFWSPHKGRKQVSQFASRSSLVSVLDLTGRTTSEGIEDRTFQVKCKNYVANTSVDAQLTRLVYNSPCLRCYIL